VRGGGKVTRQGEALGWPVLAAEGLSPAALEAAFDLCLRGDARLRARACADLAARSLAPVRESFVGELRRAIGEPTS
jgi:hypothetical protein